MRYNNGSVHTEFLPLGFCISRIVPLKQCFLENYGYYEVNFCVKFTARPFSTIHLSMDQFIVWNKFYNLFSFFFYKRGVLSWDDGSKKPSALKTKLKGGIGGIAAGKPLKSDDGMCVGLACNRLWCVWVKPKTHLSLKFWLIASEILFLIFTVNLIGRRKNPSSLLFCGQPPKVEQPFWRAALEWNTYETKKGEVGGGRQLFDGLLRFFL